MSETSEIREYYLLVEERGNSWFRVPVDEFEDLFEPVEVGRTYQFNQKSKDQQNGYWNLDSYICGCEFNHARSDWSVSDQPFVVKGVYYWHNNIYSP